MDEETSRNITGIEEKDILGQQFLEGEWEHACLTQGMERGMEPDRSVMGHGGEATKQNEQ